MYITMKSCKERCVSMFDFHFHARHRRNENALVRRDMAVDLFTVFFTSSLLFIFQLAPKKTRTLTLMSSVVNHYKHRWKTHTFFPSNLMPSDIISSTVGLGEVGEGHVVPQIPCLIKLPEEGGCEYAGGLCISEWHGARYERTRMTPRKSDPHIFFVILIPAWLANSSLVYPNVVILVRLYRSNYTEGDYRVTIETTNILVVLPIRWLLRQLYGDY